MRIIGHGIDMVEIARIKDLLDSPDKKWAEQAFIHSTNASKPISRRSMLAIMPGDLRPRKPWPKHLVQAFPAR